MNKARFTSPALFEATKTTQESPSVRPERVEGSKKNQKCTAPYSAVRYPSTSSGRTVGPRRELGKAVGPRRELGKTVGSQRELGKTVGTTFQALFVIISLNMSFATAALSITHQSILPKEALVNMKEFYNDKPVLVTGGCGFIGSHIVEKLLECGARVTIIDDLSTGFEKNIAPFKDQITLIQKSIVDPAACDEAMAGAEIVFHLAAYTSVPGSVNDPQICHNINVDGTFNLLKSASKYGVKRFVFSSTSSVYGVRDDVCHETDTDLNPVSPYGATKLMCELYCKQFSLLFNVPCVMLRYFNVFGPRQNPDSQYAAAVAKFRQRMESNEPITIFGDGTQTRDFVHVGQVAESNLLVGMAPQSNVDRELYNIGTGKSISILELSESLKKEYPNYAHEAVFAPARDGDVMHTQMSADKFNALKQELFATMDVPNHSIFSSTSHEKTA